MITIGLNNLFSYVNIFFLEISVECKENEGGVDENGKDGDDDEKDNKMNGDMEHGPEPKPEIPTQSNSQPKNSHQVTNLPDKNPNLLVCKVTGRFSIIRLPEQRVEQEEVSWKKKKFSC